MLAQKQNVRQKHSAAPPSTAADVQIAPSAELEPKYPSGPVTPEMEAIRANSQKMTRNLDAMTALLDSVRAN